MKSKLRTWKLIDIIGQLLALILPAIVVNVVHQDHYGDKAMEAIFSTLYSVGAWQTLSFFIHLGSMKAVWIAKGRKVYNVFYALLAGTVLIGWLGSQTGADEMGFMMLVVLAIAGPIMAVLCFNISSREYAKIGLEPTIPFDIAS